jgi:hypothetical protein
MTAGAEIPFLPCSRRVLVVGSRVQSHAAHMYRIIRKGANIRVFTSFEEAVEWIDAPRAAATCANTR